MSAFGENLRREREMRGVSLEEISFATKISLRFLEAIEREDFSRLPGGIFSRSFIRTYARYLGLDEDRIVAEFQHSAQPQTDFDLHRMAGGNATFQRPGDRTTLIATVVAVVLLITGYMLFRYSRRAAEVPPPPPPVPVVKAEPVTPPPVPAAPATADASAASSATPVPGTVATAPAAPGTATGPGNTTPLPPATQAPAQQPAGSNAATPPGQSPSAGQVGKPSTNELVLQVAATERAWIAVEADGKMVFQRVLNPNEVQTLHAQKSFDVTAGNARSVILTLNGETLKPLASRTGEAKSIRLTRDDLKNTTP
jgi:cytoskeleton protein RodZ